MSELTGTPPLQPEAEWGQRRASDISEASTEINWERNEDYWDTVELRVAYHEEVISEEGLEFISYPTITRWDEIAEMHGLNMYDSLDMNIVITLWVLECDQNSNRQ